MGLGPLWIVVGFGLAAFGLTQGAASSSTASSLLFLGALMGMAGIWLILPGP